MPEAIPIQDRVTGSLLALACGDALGAPLEFTPQPEETGRPCLRPLWGQENAVRRFLKERGAG